ncbi:MAG: DNA methylase, partial [Clostridia bacterium]|nr:DNA methylase [Clostridia bacterium]
EDKSIGSGQVLHEPYESDKARLVVREMTDLLALDLVDNAVVADQLVLTVGYDIDNLKGERANKYKGDITIDHYGRKIPKHAHGTANLPRHTSSGKIMTDAIIELYDRIVDPTLLVRRLNISVGHVMAEDKARKNEVPMQFNLFDDIANQQKIREEEEIELEREHRRQQAVLEIKKKFGKNAILKGMNLEEGATTKDRNKQIGGHKA